MEAQSVVMNGEVADASAPVSKKTIRNEVWRDMQANNLVLNPEFTPYRIPRLINGEETATLLKDLPEFKSANNILVNPDKAQDVIRMACLQSGKTLFVQPPRLRKYLMTKVNRSEGASDEEFQIALTVKGLEEHGTPIGLEDNVPLDIVVVGSVAVSKEGHRIGQGRNISDLSLALLNSLGFIKPETLIVTAVHDSQILDIPSDIMTSHDFPVDLIVTPTQVLRTQNKAPRPEGVAWNLISERRLRGMPLLSTLRQKEFDSGKDCALKEQDSEPESDNERAFRRPRRFFKGRMNRTRRSQQNGLTQSESEQHDADGGKPMVRKRRMFYRRFYNYRRNQPQNDGAVTKQSFRNKAWQLLQKNRVVTTPRSPYNRIPGYKGVEDAVQLLRDHDLYKNANSILLNMDKTHDALRLACLEDGKKLYVMMPRLWKMLLLRVDIPEGDNKPELKYVATRQGMEEFGTKLDMSESFMLDLIIVGSVAVSKEGYRIGKGNGHADLAYAILREMNAVTAETPIVTAVHDYQVFETFPSDLFSEQDIPVDLIVTGTKVQAIEPGPRPRPNGVMWNLITERQLKMMPILSQYREKLVEQGQTCELKQEDPNQRHRNRNTLSESEPNEAGEAESGDGLRKQYRPRKFILHRRSTNGKGDIDNGAESGGNISPDTTSHRRSKMQYRRKHSIDFSIKLTNIQRNMRMRDLKTALQERSVKPVHITWQGYRGYCYLHFTKPTSEVDSETPKTGPDSILESLANLTLYSSEQSKLNTENSPPNKIIVQLAKPLPSRIEPVEQTAV